MTPEGVKREEDVDRSQSVTPSTGRKLDFVIIGALVVALGYFVWERQTEIEQIAAPGHADVASVEDTSASGPVLRSIAVLPFVNMSSDKEQEWFSDGLTEEILNALARTPDLLVTARTSSFKFKGLSEDIPTIAAALGVAHILEGSVRRGGDQLRVTAQLIRASDGFHLWSQTYDRKPEDVISLQEEVAIEIATALQTAMDPDALASMVSAGTNSVPAYNEYLKGLAYGLSTATTSDPYELLSARDAFVRAIEIDPEFALAYWELAQFWNVQLGTTYIISGTVDLSNEEILAQFDDAIEKAIEYEQDPLRRMRSRILRSIEYLQYTQALRMNTEYLEQRPNDQTAQWWQLNLLTDMSRDEELRATIEEYQERDGYDIFIYNASMTKSLISDDRPFIRAFAQEGMRRLGDSMFVVYQAHRSLLWAGDIDGASQLVPLLRSSDMPQRSKALIALRQACAENKLNDAAKIYDRLLADFPDEISNVWISHKIMNQEDAALEALIHLDNPEGLYTLTDFLSYAYFDARQFPNLTVFLESQGIEPREPREIPYRCKL